MVLADKRLIHTYERRGIKSYEQHVREHSFYSIKGLFFFLVAFNQKRDPKIKY
jgi:hypothetical protein